jgi:hypothetical protein
MEKVYLAWNVYFSFLYNLHLKHFSHSELCLRRLQKYTGPHVSLLLLSGFNQNWNGSRNFSRTPTSHVMKIFFSGSQVVICGEKTDMKDLTASHLQHSVVNVQMTVLVLICLNQKWIYYPLWWDLQPDVRCLLLRTATMICALWYGKKWIRNSI